MALCGAKGYLENRESAPSQDENLYRREAARLELSLADAERRFPGREKLVFLHYPPVLTSFENGEMLALMERYGVRRCYYGHLHGAGHAAAFEGERRGIRFTLTAADFIDFAPVFIK